MKQKMQERRRFVRIPESSPIYYEVLQGIKKGESLTKNISQGGIRFFVHEFVARGSLLKIRLTLQKTSLSFEALVRVAWIGGKSPGEKYDVGVEFMDIPEEAKEHLINYIKSVVESSTL